MAKDIRNLRDISKLAFTSSKDSEASWPNETIMLSAVVRIADNTELMAKNIIELQDNLKFYKDAYYKKIEENNHLNRKISGLKGHITKLKKKP